MSHPDDADMRECEDRNEYGYQPVNSPVTRPSAVVTAGSAPSHTQIDQGTNIDNSVNKALPWMVGLAIMATLGFSFGVMAKIDAGKAEREARMLQYYLLELDAKVIAAGIKKPEEAISKKLEEHK